MSRPRPGDAGFTLLEILVALVVLGFLLLSLSEGVRFGLRAWDSETRLVARGADMDAMERVLRGLITATDPGEASEQQPFHGAAHTVAFISRLPMSAEGLVTRMADIGLGVDAKHRLVLRWKPHPHAERLTKPEPPHETVLLENVDHVTFSYLRSAEQGGGWTDTWSAAELPRLVRISLGFPEGDRRHWPTIEAAPMIMRGEQ
jgi:general secretion pathway protein J